MPPTRRRALALTAGGVAGLLAPAPVSAYLLPPPIILRKAARRLGKSKGVAVRFAGELRPDPAPRPPGVADDRPAKPEGPVAVTERWAFGPPLRVDVNAADAREATWADGKPSGAVNLLPKAPIRTVLGQLFTEGDPSGLTITIGARRDVQHLALAGDRIAHVIGAPVRDRRTPQVWIDQDDFTVLRIIFDTDAGGVDVRLAEWDGPITQGRFPHRLSVRFGGRIIRRLDASGLG